MSYLSDKEWRTLNQIIFRIYECNTYEAFAKTLYKHLCPFLNYTKGMLVCVTEENGDFVRSDPYMFAIPSENPLAISPAISNRLRANEFLRAPWSSVFRNTDMSTPNETDNLETYKKFWESQNIHHGLHIALVYDDTPLGVCNFYRPKTMENFTQREVFILEQLMNHLALKLYRLKRFPKNTTGSPHLNHSFKKLFTDRELEILEHLNIGKSSAEMCAELFISESTLRKHLYNIFRKTGVKNRAQLVVWIKDNYDL